MLSMAEAWCSTEGANWSIRDSLTLLIFQVHQEEDEEERFKGNQEQQEGKKTV